MEAAAKPAPTAPNSLPMAFSTKKRGMGAFGKVHWFFVTNFFVSLGTYVLFGTVYGFGGVEDTMQSHGQSGPGRNVNR
jgi:hypothetical protein